MVLGGHRQVVLVRPADTTLVVHVLHYPEHVRVCPQTVFPRLVHPRGIELRPLFFSFSTQAPTS
jgi:non-homologous end joining protein Ku